MKECFGDLWQYPADVRCITTNGEVNRHGFAVMGRGNALEARKRYPGIDVVLGNLLQTQGNVVHELLTTLWTFPTKHKWRNPSDPELIVQSAVQLEQHLEGRPSTFVVVLPRPGCGNGQLQWTDVRRLLKPILSDRVHVISHSYNL